MMLLRLVPHREERDMAIKLTETQYRATAAFQDRIARACQQYGKPGDAAKATRDAERNISRADAIKAGK